MPSSWNVYYVVFLSALLALGVPALLALISHLVAEDSRKRGAHSDESSHARVVEAPQTRTALGNRINARFFLAVNAALVLITLMLALIPVAGMLRNESGQVIFLRSLIAIVTLACFAGLGLLYSSRKGDLSWITSFQPDKKESD